MVRKDTIPAAAAFSYPAAVSRVKQLQLQVLEQGMPQPAGRRG